MRRPHPAQKFQDWFTQQWAMLWGQRLRRDRDEWILGPFGQIGGIGDAFMEQLAEEEGLKINRNTRAQGLIPSLQALNLSTDDYGRLSKKVIDFYEHTSNYDLSFTVTWNPLFKLFGKLVNLLFSNRINQLNIPISNLKNAEQLNSEIITLVDPKTDEVKYRVWYRTFESTGQVVYSGVYGLCTLPSGVVSVKAVFPLPKGNATVIMLPSVGEKGELRLESKGTQFGDAGFYFVLEDAKGGLWSNYVGSFHDFLTVGHDQTGLFASQTLKLWGMRVLQFDYKMFRRP